MNDKEAALDKMLDDLKTTVGSDGEHDSRADSTLVSSFRSSSRSGSRSGSRAGYVEDGGHVKHTRHEYKTPDNQTHVVTEKYEYDTGDSSKSKHYQKKVMKSTYSNYNQLSAGSLEDPPHRPSPPQISPPQPVDTKVITASQKVANKLVDALSTIGTGTLTNGAPTYKYEPDHMIADDHKPGEVRRIVWRNRFEKTYENKDSTQPPPQMTIEEEARRRTLTRNTTGTSTTSTSTLSSPPQRGPVSPPRHPQLQCAVVWPGYGPPNNISPGSQSWKEPIPMPTPPQLSPREPGVAYIYSYSGQQNSSGVQPLPPLNYVNVPGPHSVSEGAPSPTPSSVNQQPIIYHYSYHYNIMPGQQPPDGVPLPPGGTLPPGATLTSTPAVQAPPGTQHPPHSHTHLCSHTQCTHTTTECNRHHPGHPCHPDHPCHHSHCNCNHPSHPNQPGQPSVNYNVHSSYSKTTRETTTRDGTTPRDRPERLTDDPSYPRKPGTPNDAYPHKPGTPHDGYPHKPGTPHDGYPHKPGTPHDSYPRKPGTPHDSDPTPGGPKGNINITINKTTTTRTIHEGYPGDGSDAPPVTSTPYSSRGRSISPEPRTPNHHHITYHTTHINRNSTDSLDRVRRPKDEPLPFPNTTPIKGNENNKIPRRVDDLMTSFSDSEDGGPHGPGRHPRRPDPADHEPLLPANQVSVRAEADAKAKADAESKRELSKNKAGPPVYYPPGHELFHETMHTMTLKEGGRRGRAKWRAERSAGYKESASHSESKGGMTMVPICLPLCCGGACVLM